MITQKRTNSKKANVNSTFLVYFVYLVCFMFVVGLILWFLCLTVKANEIPKPVPKEFTLTARHITLPSEKDFEELQEMYRQISNSFADLENLDVEIRRLYEEVKAAKVSTYANWYNNFLRDYSNAYENQLSELQESISSYEEMYTAYLNSINDIPKCFPLYYEKYNEFNESLGNTYEVVFEKNQQCLANNEELFEFSLEAQLIADTLYDEEYELMCHIVNAEGGGCPVEEQYYIALVVEHRIMHSDFPNNIHDVVYSGAYTPTITGSINKTPSTEVRQNMENLLRGRVKVDMPLDVVYQSKGIQGPIWKAMDSGHYFCHYN